MPWLLATTKPSMQDAAAESSAREGFNCLLLKYEKTFLRRGRKVRTAEPVFGCYLFVEMVEGWPKLLKTRGISGVVRAGEDPQPVPDAAIAELMGRLDERGLFIMPKRGAAWRFSRGERVTPSEGPLKYFVGLFEGSSGSDREAALFSMLGCQRRFEFKSGILLAA